jgi:hypothetical protein
MCRLFGLTSGTVPVRATFWLLDAPDSLEAQSHRNADGSGIGFFGPDRAAVLDKQPEPAFIDEEFIRARAFTGSRVSRSSPDRIRTGVTALRGRRPRPLDDGAEHVPDRRPCRAGIRYHRQRTDYRFGHGEANRRLAAPGTDKRGRDIHPR